MGARSFVRLICVASLLGCGGRSTSHPGDGGLGDTADGHAHDGSLPDGGGHDTGGLDGAAGVCTPGQDQTCNDSPTVSGLWGACNADGTCRCNPGYMINPQTGKCRPNADGGTAVCTPGQDDTCADDPFVPATVIHCNSDGTCSCGSSEYFLNPSTGKCRWGTCDMLAQDCPAAADGCFPPDPSDSALTPHCGPTGTTPDGSPCSSDHDCREGSTCQMFTSATKTCLKMCDPVGGSISCPNGESCAFLWQRAGMPGLCVPL